MSVCTYCVSSVCVCVCVVNLDWQPQPSASQLAGSGNGRLVDTTLLPSSVLVLVRSVCVCGDEKAVCVSALWCPSSLKQILLIVLRRHCQIPWVTTCLVHVANLSVIS